MLYSWDIPEMTNGYFKKFPSCSLCDLRQQCSSYCCCGRSRLLWMAALSGKAAGVDQGADAGMTREAEIWKGMPPKPRDHFVWWLDLAGAYWKPHREPFMVSSDRTMALETSLDCRKDGAKQSVHMRGIDSAYIVNIECAKEMLRK